MSGGDGGDGTIDTMGKTILRENWDVEKVLNHVKAVDRRGTYHSIDEVFLDV
ncbi:hypothetical protein [Methanocalculus sp. MSAO_Arc2]|uniref:hypothetical protein n=1 Tax=Methanocalculus sp. MSAO_Arc2 TaxID=2293855 RepID=UPI00269BC110